jgi:mRNA interferase MazF
MKRVRQCEIWLVNLNPSKGSEQAGTRPVLVVSGNLMNTHLNGVICCPLTSKIKNYKGNIILSPNKRNNLTTKSEVMTFHIRSISKDRLIKKVGEINEAELEELKLFLDDILRY